MDTNQNNTSINVFNKGMNTDASYCNIQEGQYLYAENLRNYMQNGDSNGSNTNQYGSIQAIEGCDWKTFNLVDFEGNEFQIESVLAADTIRNIGIIIVNGVIKKDDDIKQQWAVVRATLSDQKTLEDPKIIYLSGTDTKNQLVGDKVSIVLKYETEKNIKLYIADGEHFMLILNVAEKNDEHNKKISGDLSKIENIQHVFLNPIKFLGLTTGNLTAGVVQYAYRLYDQNGSASPMSCITNTIQLVQNEENSNSQITKGGSKGRYIGCGVKLQIKLEKEESSAYNHIEIYRIYYEEGGQLPKVGVIYNKKIPQSDTIDYTDFGQQYLSEITVDEFNNISGIHIIPKVLESKNGRLFAANIKDSASSLNDIANHFDARAFRFNRQNKTVYSQYSDQNTTYSKTREDIDNESQYDSKNDTSDYFNEYNDVTKTFNIEDDVCRLGELTEDGTGAYYGGYGKNIKWRFVITELVGDYSNVGNPSGKRQTNPEFLYENVGAVGNTLITNYVEDTAPVKAISYNNKLKYGYVVQNLTTGDNSIELQPEEDYTDLFESSNKTCTYSNSCISYGFRSLKRDELYRFGIVLYNKRNEATPVMWIGDVRTPPCNEKCFDTYESNVHNTSLVVRPLGIEFKVDLTSINDYIAKNDDYNESDQIVAYEIVRCYRSSKDVQNIAQGVLSRPVRKTKNENAANVTIDPVYTPTGILTTQSYWNGESWVSHNGCLKEVWSGDKLKNANGYEADNFDNRTLFQFICPEACYNSDYMKGVIDNTNLSIQPFFYIFGQGKGKTHALDTCNELVRADNGVGYGPYIKSHRSLQSYYYTSTAWSNNQQPLPPYATKYDIIDSSSGVIDGAPVKLDRNPYVDYGVDFDKNPGAYLPIDQFVLKSIDFGFIDDSVKLVLFAPSGTCKEKQKDYPKLQDNQLYFIYDSYGRTAIDYFENKASTRNGQDLIVGAELYENNANHGFRSSREGREYLTYKTPERHYKGAANVGALGQVVTPADKNYMNCVQYCYGYSKLYEKTPVLYTRVYDDSDKTTKLFGTDFPERYNINGTEKYSIKNAAITNALNWDDIFSGDTQNGTTAWSYKYNDYVQPIGISTYCNVIMGGKYGESKYISKSKEQGLFYKQGATKISYGDMPSGLVSTAGNSILVNLESEDNILYKNIATDSILKHTDQYTSLSGYEFWYSDSRGGDEATYEHSCTEQPTLFSANGIEVDPQISEASKDKTSIYDTLQLGGMSTYIYRSSIAGTYLCNLKQNIVPYNGYQYTSRLTNTYVSCGNYYKYNPNEKKIVFNGDCYIQPFEYVSAHKYYYKDVASPVTTCLIYTFPVETNINIIASHGHEFSKNLDNKGLCTNLQQQPANVNDIYAQDNPEYVYNTAYSQQPNAQTHEVIDISDDSNTLSHVDYRCYYSELKSNNENIDSWQVFKPANFLDVDDRYGEITHLRTFNNILMFWQEHATGQFSVNERSQISDDSGKPIVLGVGDVLSRYDYVDYTTGMHKEQYCDACSNTSLYWFDSHNSEIKTLSGNGVVQLNKTHNTQNIMHEYSGISAPVMFYDKKYNEVVSKVLHGDPDKSIAYNEMIQAFTSVYDLDFENHLTFDNNIYLLNPSKEGKLNIGHWNNGTQNVNTKLKYVVNANPGITKVFDNQEIVTEQYKNTNIENFRFTWYTEISGDTTYEQPKITNREGNYRYSLPRVGQNAVYGNRLRGKYMIGEIDNIITPVSYIITKFRKSCS